MYKKIIIFVAILGASFVATPRQTGKHQNIEVSVSAVNTSNEVVRTQVKVTPELTNKEPFPTLSAKAVLALDVNTGLQLYGQNFDVRLPIASLTKLMTAMVVLDHVNKDQVATIQKSDLVVSCLCMGLSVGEQITVENLLKGMLIPSNNDAAVALSRHVSGDEVMFVALMNQKATQLGLKDTHFSNPAGLDSLDNYSTALDLSKITQEFLKYALLERIVATGGQDVTSVDGKIVHSLRTSNKLLLENSEVVGVKTGFTTDAQGNLIMKIDHEGIEVLTVVLNTPNREEDTKKFIDWIFKAYKW